MTHRVRTTMQPDREIELSDADYASLKAQGLLIEEDRKKAAPEELSTPAAAPAPSPSNGKRSSDKES
ncbi:hypothetical protein K378_01446 [Streptomyces sp. Amel2xB2]|uniref:hypothetical protein n=1 Tax=Streptomyces sp. Amel2xB2 TaxID=1305829 RepID=UPI000DBA6CF0|nr:hypothetical protein [Streptomyces sp. Amel2xB2]RAJ70281.1 hypothetical protein K378_01446 [Streptomyces sp. Amel2xB2]